MNQTAAAWHFLYFFCSRNSYASSHSCAVLPA